MRRAARMVASGAVIAALASSGLLPPAPAGAQEPVQGLNLQVRTNYGDGTFTFTTDIPDTPTLTVTTEERKGHTQIPLEPGTYTLAQIGPPAPYRQAGVGGQGCTQGPGNSFTVTVVGGDIVTCMVTNAVTGLDVGVVTNGPDGTFGFTSDVPGAPAFTVETRRTVGQEEATGVQPGTYTVTLTDPPAPFVLSHLVGDCTQAGPSAATVVVAADSFPRCRFLIRAQGPAIEGPDVTGPFSPTRSRPLVDLPDLLDDRTGVRGGVVDAGGFLGLTAEQGVSVPDTVGAIGPGHYVQMVNVAFAVFDRAGALLAGPSPVNSLWAGAGGQCAQNNDGDPIVLYDEHADRWLLSQFAVQGGEFAECVAVSETGDPTGRYRLYEFPVPRFPDFPKLGVHPDTYVLTTQPNSGFTSADVFALDRRRMLAGEPSMLVRFGVGVTAFPIPADLGAGHEPPAGSPAWIYTRENEQSATWVAPPRLDLFALMPRFDAPATSTLALTQSLPVEPFELLPCGGRADCVPQRAPGARLDPAADIPQSPAVYRNFESHETLAGTFTVNAGAPGGDQTGVRWFELRRSGGGSWTTHAEGMSPTGDGTSRFLGSAGIDRTGGIAVGYSASSASSAPSIRALTSPPDLRSSGGGQEVVLHAGTGVQVQNYRWGDYSSMTVDPLDDCTFWFTTEYYAADGVEWQTRVSHFRQPACGVIGLDLDLSADRLEVAPGGTVTYRLAYANTGEGTATGAVLSAVVPSGTTFAGPGGWDGCQPGAPAGTVCSRSLGTLAGGSSATADLAVAVDQSASGSVELAAMLRADYSAGAVEVAEEVPVVAPAPPPPREPAVGTAVRAAVSGTLPAAGWSFAGIMRAALLLMLAGSALVRLGARMRLPV